jgi:hypothetical protein
MIYPLNHRAARNIPVLTPLLFTLALLFTVGIALADGGGEDGAAEDRHKDGQKYERPSRAGYARSLFQGCLLRVDT